MAGEVIAWSDGVVYDGVGADEADLSVGIVVAFGAVCLGRRVARP